MSISKSKLQMIEFFEKILNLKKKMNNNNIQIVFRHKNAYKLVSLFSHIWLNHKNIRILEHILKRSFSDLRTCYFWVAKRWVCSSSRAVFYTRRPTLRSCSRINLRSCTLVSLRVSVSFDLWLPSESQSCDPKEVSREYFFVYF